MIDNTGEIDYSQLYAQVVYELQELKAPYWFNNDEVARILSNRVRLGKMLSAAGFKSKDHSHILYYEVVPLRAA